MDFKYLDRPLTNLSKTKLDKVLGIVLISEVEYFNKDEMDVYQEINKLNVETKDVGYHYALDDLDKAIYNSIDPKYQAHYLNGKPTYISRALFEEKPNEKVLFVYINIADKYDYEKTEEKLIRFLVSVLRENKLTAKDVWRAFDVDKENTGPLHLLDKSIFEKYITEIEKFIPSTEHEGGVEESYPQKEDSNKDKPSTEEDDKIKIESPFKEVAEKAGMSINDYVCKIYKENKDNAKNYASKYQPWDKGRQDVKEAAATSGELQSRKTPYGNLLQYKITELPPAGLDHCEKPVDKLEGIETAQETMVEPIYPDLITPPGGMVHIADGISETKVQSQSNVPLTSEELEKRQKTFDFSKFNKMKKVTKGRPLNTEDPFPVDDQIKKLEQHFPKVKVDKVTFDFKDTNHPGSEIGNAMAKNYAMCYDMVTEVAKRVEQRLVKIENNLSTVMRYTFRMGSRMNINCVYYGGQTDYAGKYKCIRCLHDDRINDGAICTIDQCLTCTRYEPILGQIYAILDETGSNIVQVMDDLQMSYMELNDYKNLNSVNEYHEQLRNVNVSQHSDKKPKPFIEDKWKDTEAERKEKFKNVKDSNDEKDKKKESISNGFKMDWNPTVLETQNPNINEYKTEGLEAEKKPIKPSNQGFDRDRYVDTRENAVEYERLEFNVKDYEFADFGIKDDATGADGQFGMGAMEVRQKIVDYALAAVKLCKEGKAWYSLDNRDQHGDKNVGGKQYWDCSSLVRDAYKEAGLGIIGQITYDQFDKCKNSAGGKLFPLTDVSQALPGDIVFFYDGQPKNLSTEKLQKVNKNGVRHVAIFIGDGQIAHASNEKHGIVQTDLNWDKGSFCFGRPKVLIDLDNQAGGSGGISEVWSRKYQGIDDKLWKQGAVGESNAKSLAANMKKYNYRDILVEEAKKAGFDPVFIAAICAVETDGNPLAGGNYPGIMQSTGSIPGSTPKAIRSQIAHGCSDLKEKANWLKKYGWTDKNNPVLATAHNCGPYGTTDALGHTHVTPECAHVPIPVVGKKANLNTVKIPEISELISKYTSKFQKGWSVSEKAYYSVKILRAYNVIYDKNYLNLPRQTNGNVATPSGMPTIQKKQIAYNYGKRNGAIKYIVIHDTANPGGTAQNHFDYFNGGNRGASADYFVDSGSIIEINNPKANYTWQVGDGHGKYGITNQNAVGIEMCLEKNGSISSQTFNNAVNLAKYLMKVFNIPKDRVVRHYDASRKICPEQFSKSSWERWNEFKSKI